MSCMDPCRNDDELTVLLTRFNRRDTSAFTSVYMKYFTELHTYARRLYATTSMEPDDVVQDVFCNLWERTDITFDSFLKIKAFLFVAIKNSYRNYVNHLEVERKYKNVAELNGGFENDIVESELGASLLEYVERIPDPGGKVMKLYLSGFEAEEIAEKLRMSIRTVYNTKHRAIGMLKGWFRK